MEIDTKKLKEEILKELKDRVGDTDELNDGEFQDKIFSASVRLTIEMTHKNTIKMIKDKIENFDIDKELKDYEGERTEFVSLGMNMFKNKLLTLLE